ncbi:hypothetical protein [Desulfobacter sp.]|uniref:hypothetical protein n=1 Tax=Desulfobacter sp. TaxID=2294 RepID=UPI003D0F2BC2
MYSCTEIDEKTTYVCALAPNLSEVASWLRQNQSLYLILCADTLIIDEDEILPVSTAVQIAARNILVRKKGTATVTIDSSEEITGLEICTQGVLGSLQVGFPKDKTETIALSGAKTTIFTWTKGGKLNSKIADAKDLSDNLKSWTAKNALRASFSAGAQLIYSPDYAADSVAMLQWVSDCCAAILNGAKGNPDPGKNIGAPINALVQQANALLVYAKAADAGITTVPVLSDTYYAHRLESLLDLAKDFQDVIDNLQKTEEVEKTLEEFADALTQTTYNNEEPLRSELDSYTASYSLLYDSYLKLIGLYQVQSGVVQTARETLDKAIQEQKIKDMFNAAFDLVKSAVSAGKAVAEFAAEDYAGGAGDALESFTSYIEAVDKFTDPSMDELKDQAEGLKISLTGMAGVGKSAYDVWKSVTYKGGTVSFSDAAALETSIESASLGGDPGLSWELFSLKVDAVLDGSMPSGIESAAKEYKAALKSQCLYGEAIMNKAVSLMHLSYQLADTAGRLVAVQNNLSVWEKLSQNTKEKEKRIEVQKAFVQERFMDIKRSLFVALINYQAAYRYFYLTPCPTTISLDMNYLALSSALHGVDVEIGQLLNPSRPLQDFKEVSWPLDVDGEQAAELDSNKYTWNISIDDTAFVSKVTASHSKALFLESVEFYVYPEPPHGTIVQMKIGPSGVMNLESSNGQRYTFTCEQPFELDAEYVSGGAYTTKWQPSEEVKAYYMKPSPFSIWHLKLIQPESEDGESMTVSKIEMKLSGVYWPKTDARTPTA